MIILPILFLHFSFLTTQLAFKATNPIAETPSPTQTNQHYHDVRLYHHHHHHLPLLPLPFPIYSFPQLFHTIRVQARVGGSTETKRHRKEAGQSFWQRRTAKEENITTNLRFWSFRLREKKTCEKEKEKKKRKKKPLTPFHPIDLAEYHFLID